MERKPTIGIPRLREYDALYINYLGAVVAGGGEPLVIEPVFDEIDDQIASCDGFLFMGGPDFSQHLSHCKGGNRKSLPPEWEKFYYEFGRRVLLGTDKPALGICLGCQLINIVYGGSLIGDIQTQIPGAFWHERPQSNNKLETMHEVRFPERSPLRELYGCDWMCANSSHHQSVETLGTGLIVAALAGDGVVEAITPEDINGRFVVGLQWHPERLYNIVDGHLTVFKALCEAAANQR